VPQPTPIPDDWDADDNEEEPDAKDLWETAYMPLLYSFTPHTELRGRNSRIPMPEIQLSTTSSSSGVSLPPPAAFEAPLRILKRPSAANSKSPSPVTGPQPQKTFQEREAQYQAARERIFGEDGSGIGKDGSGSGKLTTALDSARSSISRDPLGPASMTDGEAKQGFRARRKKGVRAEAETSILGGEEIKEPDHLANS
jgi:SUZ domain